MHKKACKGPDGSIPAIDAGSIDPEPNNDGTLPTNLDCK